MTDTLTIVSISAAKLDSIRRTLVGILSDLDDPDNWPKPLQDGDRETFEIDGILGHALRDDIADDPTVLNAILD